MPSPAASRASRLLLAVSILCCAAVASPARGQDIHLTGGSHDASGTSGMGPLVLEGDRGFTFRGVTYNGNYQPAVCTSVVCKAGDRISIFASWSGSDLFGTATLDGNTYPRVGDNFDTSPTASTLMVNFHGTLQLPPWSAGSTVLVPFVLTGTFRRVGASDALTGGGLATVELYPIPGYPEERWAVKRILYDLGTPLASPWVSQDIGAVGLRGHASMHGDTIALVGDGGDIWGTADAFRFAYRETAGAARVSARVMTAQKIYPDTRPDTGGLNPYAKAGVMIRESDDPDAPSVVLDMKPNGELEFMVRYVRGEPTTYLGGAMTGGGSVWLSLARDAGGVITASYSHDGAEWTSIGNVTLAMDGPSFLGGLAVTSHDATVLNGVLFDHVSVTGETAGTNLLEHGDFEDDDPPLLGPPGWISDHLLRQVPAKSETHQPRSGLKNGACWTTEHLDCGIYQEVSAPVSGSYTFRIYASADRTGGLVGVNVNGSTAASRDVARRPFGVYEPYTMTFSAIAGDVIRVWMYSPPVPGYVVIDDGSLVARTATREITSGTWSITPISGAFCSFDLGGDGFAVQGTCDGGVVGPIAACSAPGKPCTPGQAVPLTAHFENQTPVTFESHARGSGEVDGTSYDFVELGGVMRLNGGTVVLPTPADEEGGLVSVSASFTASGEVRGYDVRGLRDPRLVFSLPASGHGTATLELIAAPSPTGGVAFTVYRVTYAFE